MGVKSYIRLSRFEKTAILSLAAFLIKRRCKLPLLKMELIFKGRLIKKIMFQFRRKNKKMEQNDTLPKTEATSEATVNPTETTENSDFQAEIASLKKENEGLTVQVAEMKDKFLRNYAEFDNFKKRTARERQELFGTAARDTMSALLPVLDDFDRAAKNETFTEGMQLLYQKFHNVLRSKGLKIMESNGETFDPALHEAITEIPVPNEALQGKVIDTVENGYFLNDKLIRFAKVVVGK
jgi:molecular chaperone GrpE